ncbi:MAG: archaetidylinositol phosphate synthase [Candidatus Bathyarchaeota archaeon]|nr:archaetidylinositol phosphate synthase [Candidatus Bathyarchaeota archaeon]
MLTKLKEKFQLWIASEAKMAHKIGLTPNHVSAIGIILAIFSTLAYWAWQANHLLLIVAPFLLLVSGFCDALDGAIARLHKQTTTFGGFLDSLLDRYADAVVFLGIIIGGLCDPFWGLTALIGSLLVSYTRARAEATGIKMEAVGVAERADRLFILAIASFLSIVWLEALNLGIIVLAFLSNLTVLQRVVYFYKASKDR